MRRSPLLLSGLGLLALTGLLRADVTVAPLFQDHAVLQQDLPVNIWGRADADEVVQVRFAGQRVETKAGPDGRWRVVLQPMPPNAKGEDLAVAGKNTVTLRDVLVGEVWLCSGQSNMEMAVEKAANAAEEQAGATFPAIRQIKIDRHPSSTPRETIRGAWQVTTPATVGAFTAIGYFFARQLQQELGRPVGLVNASYGGTPIESWMSPGALASDPAFDVVAARWRQTLADYQTRRSTYEVALAKWTEEEAATQGEGAESHAAFLKQRPKPKAPTAPAGGPFEPAGLYHGMIHPLVPYTIRGVLWYQGESTRNVQHPEEYRGLFSALIRQWRMDFGQPNLPFFWVQLPNYEVPNEPSGVAWPRIREAQAETLALPHTAMAVAIDLGERTNIHPRNKQAVAQRLGALALTEVYGKPAEGRSLMFARAERDGAAIRIHFAPTGGNLVNRGEGMPALQIAGADRNFHAAEGRIDGDTLLVRSASVADPVAVRYAWTNCPTATLYGKNGLPVAPFRTDAW